MAGHRAAGAGRAAAAGARRADGRARDRAPTSSARYVASLKREQITLRSALRGPRRRAARRRRPTTASGTASRRPSHARHPAADRAPASQVRTVRRAYPGQLASPCRSRAARRSSRAGLNAQPRRSPSWTPASTPARSTATPTPATTPSTATATRARADRQRAHGDQRHRARGRDRGRWGSGCCRSGSPRCAPSGGAVEAHATTDELLAGLEHAVDPNGDGDTSDHVPVALVGVNAPYAGFSRLARGRRPSPAPRGLGTLVVAPAGNEGAAAPGQRHGRLARVGAGRARRRRARGRRARSRGSTSTLGRRHGSPSAAVLAGDPPAGRRHRRPGRATPTPAVLGEAHDPAARQGRDRPGRREPRRPGRGRGRGRRARRRARRPARGRAAAGDRRRPRRGPGRRRHRRRRRRSSSTPSPAPRSRFGETAARPAVRRAGRRRADLAQHLAGADRRRPAPSPTSPPPAARSRRGAGGGAAVAGGSAVAAARVGRRSPPARPHARPELTPAQLRAALIAARRAARACRPTAPAPARCGARGPPGRSPPTRPPPVSGALDPISVELNATGSERGRRCAPPTARPPQPPARHAACPGRRPTVTRPPARRPAPSFGRLEVARAGRHGRRRRSRGSIRPDTVEPVAVGALEVTGGRRVRFTLGAFKRGAQTADPGRRAADPRPRRRRRHGPPQPHRPRRRARAAARRVRLHAPARLAARTGGYAFRVRAWAPRPAAADRPPLATLRP